MYNEVLDTYDARHEQMNADEFRAYIAKQIADLKSSAVSRKLRRCPILLFNSNGVAAVRYNRSASSRDSMSSGAKPSFSKNVRTLPE